ncbi:MAG: hypothetical protein KIT25_12335 [Enhydrobacter sp.]|nr:MAG: hypothetical protein KIT25_12335 [Enhydrobacter sp.]
MKKTMSRRAALATAASVAIVPNARGQDRPQLALASKSADDPALLAADRCTRARRLFSWASKHAERTKDFSLERRVNAVYGSLQWNLINTRATTLQGVLAKLDEQLPECLHDPEPDMDSVALQSIYADLKRMAGHA